MEKGRRKFLGLSAMAATLGIVPGVLYAEEKKDKEIKCNGLVKHVDEERMGRDSFGRPNDQSYEIVRILNACDSPDASNDPQLYVVFSATPLKEGDYVSFSYIPETEITDKNIHKYIGDHREKLNIQGLTGVITSYRINKASE